MEIIIITMSTVHRAIIHSFIHSHIFTKSLGVRHCSQHCDHGGDQAAWHLRGKAVNCVG